VSLSDKQSRLIKKNAGAAPVVGYNVQTVVDEKHHLMLLAKATNACNDFGQLSTMAAAAKQELEVQNLEVLVDGGYRNAAQLAHCEANGISVHLPAHQDAQQERGLYGREAFVYDAAANEYCCPGGQRLKHAHVEQRRGLAHHVYYNYAACRACVLRAQCTGGTFRRLKRTEGHEALDAAAARVRDQPEIYARRKAIVEHPFGTLKFWWGHGSFLLRGLQEVNAEVQLSALAYNLRRVLNVVGVRRLLEHLKAKKSLHEHVDASSHAKIVFRFSTFNKRVCQSPLASMVA